MLSTRLPSGITHARPLAIGSGCKSTARMNLGSTTWVSRPFGHLKLFLLDVREQKSTFNFKSSWQRSTNPKSIIMREKML